MKLCRLCKEAKPTEAFHARRDSPDGWHTACRECLNKKRARQYEQNRERDISAAMLRNKRRRAACPSARIAHSRRGALQRAIRDQTEEPGVVRDLGCSVAALRAHLESQFSPGMTWHNRGSTAGCWSVDHVQPLASFDLTKPAQSAIAFHWTNLQPMWHNLNLKKGSRPVSSNQKETRCVEDAE